jgi:hypothetical protein
MEQVTFIKQASIRDSAGQSSVHKAADAVVISHATYALLNGKSVAGRLGERRPITESFNDLQTLCQLCLTSYCGVLRDPQCTGVAQSCAIFFLRATA